MDELFVFVGSLKAGVLSRDGGKFHFRYDSGYAGPPVFLGVPVAEKERSWEGFPPPFENLLPEGVLLEQLLRTRKLDRSDQWGQLSAVGGDLVGFLQVVPPDHKPSGRFEIYDGIGLPKRKSIEPRALPYSISELVTFHSTHPPRMSISGVQPKASAVFSPQSRQFQLVDFGGSYILKPSSQAYPGTAENEALSMSLARRFGISVPSHGLVLSKEGIPVYWVQRFDRFGPKMAKRLRMEDFCQLKEIPSSWKYLGEIEHIVDVIERFCSNPKLQLALFFERVLFSWIIGNDDMHLKNWSLLEVGPLVELSPLYDAVNSVVLTGSEEESALSLNGKKKGWTREDIVESVGVDLCGLNDRVITRVLGQIDDVPWKDQIRSSQMTEEAKVAYGAIVEDRLKRLRD